jgi:hypothetical protein
VVGFQQQIGQEAEIDDHIAIRQIADVPADQHCVPIVWVLGLVVERALDLHAPRIRPFRLRIAEEVGGRRGILQGVDRCRNGRQNVHGVEVAVMVDQHIRWRVVLSVQRTQVVEGDLLECLLLPVKAKSLD